ncbi:MAG: hypothetical protein FJ125_07350 [Deltaproteobacteria bacterium]|nr:hypothetical protein [Deltaproteobacteria bacterium]
MEAETLVRWVVQALLLALVLSLPALGGAAAAELAAWGVERVSGRSLSTAMPLLRLVGVAAGLALAAPWIGQQLLQYVRLVLLSFGEGGGAAAGP